MVTKDDEIQPQIGDANWEPPQPGADSPQAVETPTDAPDGGAGAPKGGPETPTPRTYTQEEWQARESAKDKEAAHARQMAARLALDLQAARDENAESQRVIEDVRAVERGDLTEDEATQRSRQRMEDIRTASQRQRERQAHAQLMAHGEEVGRAVAAEDLSKEYGVDAVALLNDPALADPTQMRSKARELAADKREEALKARENGDETYDGGGGGGGGGRANIDSMTPEGKIAYALAHPPKRPRQ